MTVCSSITMYWRGFTCLAQPYGKSVDPTRALIAARDSTCPLPRVRQSDVNGYTTATTPPSSSSTPTLATAFLPEENKTWINYKMRIIVSLHTPRQLFVCFSTHILMQLLNIVSPLILYFHLSFTGLATPQLNPRCS